MTVVCQNCALGCTALQSSAFGNLCGICGFPELVAYGMLTRLLENRMGAAAFGQTRLAAQFGPRNDGNTVVQSLWILSGCRNRSLKKMLDKVTQTSSYNSYSDYF